MLKEITVTHPVFNGEYLNAAEFFIMDRIRYDAPLLLSDGESIIVCGTPDFAYPLWVWTAEGVSSAVLDEFAAWLKDGYPVKHGAFFVARPAVADLIADCFADREKTFERRIRMMAHDCPAPLPVAADAPPPERPTEVDLDRIADMCIRFQFDCYGEVLPVDQAKAAAERIIESPFGFVLREGEKPVAMACGSKWGNGVRRSISWVYTLPERRGRGFAAALTSHIAQLILQTGDIPFLYTDLANPCSNRAYAKAGFLPRGQVDELKLRWDRD